MKTTRSARTTCLLALAGLLVTVGCATRSTVATRRQERAAAYAALAPAQQAQVDQGQIDVGMNEDAVYIAWGQPAQVLQSGDSSGRRTIWLYQGTTSDDYVYWRYYEVPRPKGGGYLTRTLERDINVREYISAELIFHEGKLESWRTLPKPPSQTYTSPGP